MDHLRCEKIEYIKIAALQKKKKNTRADQFAVKSWKSVWAFSQEYNHFSDEQ